MPSRREKGSTEVNHTKRRKAKVITLKPKHTKRLTPEAALQEIKREHPEFSRERQRAIANAKVQLNRATILLEKFGDVPLA